MQSIAVTANRRRSTPVIRLVIQTDPSGTSRTSTDFLRTACAGDGFNCIGTTTYEEALASPAERVPRRGRFCVPKAGGSGSPGDLEMGVRAGDLPLRVRGSGPDDHKPADSSWGATKQPAGTVETIKSAVDKMTGWPEDYPRGV